MKRILFALATLAAVASAACRQYDVDVYKNLNRIVYGLDGATQSFICTADSLLWADIFIGAANIPGRHYKVEILDLASNQEVYWGQTAAAGQNYEYVRDSLQRFGSKPLIKGETYLLQVTIPDAGPEDSLNYYYSDQNPYPYGELSFPGSATSCDLCARIEGINRPVSREFFGVAENLYGVDSVRRDSLLSLAQSAGATGIREQVHWSADDSTAWRTDSVGKIWPSADSIFGAFYRHNLSTVAFLSSCPGWASSDSPPVTSNDYAPLNLFDPVTVGGSINPENYWADFVYRSVKRYKPGGDFWPPQGIHDYGITDWEIWNEPQFWKPPQRGYESLRDTFHGSDTSLIEDLYARLCVVACSAAHKVDPGAHVIIGGGLSDVFEHYDPTYHSVDGATWLAGFYRCGGCGGMDYGASVHPYQGDWRLGGLNPDTFDCDLDTIRTIRRLYGDEGKELLVTEAAYDAGNSNQAAISLPEIYMLSLSGSPLNFYDRVFWFVLHNAGQEWSSELLDVDSTGSITKQPSYYACRQMTGELVGKRINGRVLSGDSVTDAQTRVYELEDTTTHKKTWVGWRNYGQSAEDISVKVPARTEYLDTSYLARSQTDNYGHSVSPVVAGPNGWFQFNADTFPLYVHEDTGTTDTISRADLAVDSVWTTFVSGQPRSQERWLWARVRNVGNALSGSGQALTTLKFYANDSLVAQAICPSLQHGESTRVSGLWQIAGSGYQMVKAVVNESRSFVELNWDNNAKYRLFHILPIQGEQGSLDGSRTMARAAGSSPTQAVAEFTESGNPLVFYCPRLDSATSGWDSLTAGRCPAVSLDAAGNPWVVSTRGDSSDTLYALVRRADSTWKQVKLYSTMPGQHLGRPALAVFQTQGSFRGSLACLGNVVFPVYSPNSAPPSYIVNVRFDSVPGMAFPEVVDYGTTECPDSCVTLCAGAADSLWLCYGSGPSVYAREARYDTTGNPPLSWSLPVALGDTGAGRVVRHPFCDKVSDRVYCVYRQQDPMGMVSVARSLHLTEIPAGDWVNLPPSSMPGNNPKDWPVFSGDNSVAWAESSGAGWQILARVGIGPDMVVNLSDTSTDAKYPHILADSMKSYSPSSDRINVHCLWNEQLAGDTCEVMCQPVPVTFAHAAPNATEYNNGHKLLLGPGGPVGQGETLYTVFSANSGACGIVGYAKLAPGSTDWSRSLPMAGDVPSIGRDSAGEIWFVCRGPMATSICAMSQASGAASQMTTLYDCHGNYPPLVPESVTVGVPSIAGFQYNRFWGSVGGCYAVFPVYDQRTDSSFILLVKALPNNTVLETDTLDRAVLGLDSSPSIGVLPGNYLHLVWQRGERVYARTGADTLAQSKPIAWSSCFAISDTDSLARHPAIEVSPVSPDTVLVAWSEGTVGRIRVRGQLPPNAIDAWDTPITVSDTSSHGYDYPSISIRDTVIIAYQRANQTGADIFANIGLARNFQVPSNGPAEYCHVLYQPPAPGGDTEHILHCVWSEEPSAGFYDVGYAALPLSSCQGGGPQSASIFDPAIKPMLFAPAPNPFNRTTSIRYQTNIDGRTSVVIHDVTGRRVCNVMTANQRPGVYHVTWFGKDDRQRRLPEGIYFVRLQTPNYSECKKLVLTQ